SSRPRRAAPALSPYTTLFRSVEGQVIRAELRRLLVGGHRLIVPVRLPEQVPQEEVQVGIPVKGGHRLLGRDDGPLLIALQAVARSEEHTSELQSRENLVCRPL